MVIILLYVLFSCVALIARMGVTDVQMTFRTENTHTFAITHSTGVNAPLKTAINGICPGRALGVQLQVNELNVL